MSSCPLHTAVTSWASLSSAGNPSRGCILYSHCASSIHYRHMWLKNCQAASVPQSLALWQRWHPQHLGVSSGRTWQLKHWWQLTSTTHECWASCQIVEQNQKIRHIFVHTFQDNREVGSPKCLMWGWEAQCSHYGEVHLLKTCIYYIPMKYRNRFWWSQNFNFPFERRVHLNTCKATLHNNKYCIDVWMWMLVSCAWCENSFQV